MTLTLKGRVSASLRLPRLPAAVSDDHTTTAKQELERCYRRIADLETRIHDLTLQNNVVRLFIIMRRPPPPTPPSIANGAHI